MIRILNLGAGVQSTTVYLLSHEGLIDPIDYAIFADTQEEPAAVYQHLAWLRTVPAPVPIILTGTVGRLGDHLITGRRSGRKDRLKKNGERFASIPAFTAEPPEIRLGPKVKEGRTRRQCTKEYKTEEVDRIIRYEILKLKPRQRMPKDVMIEQSFGISWDERIRAVRIESRFKELKWSMPRFPLIELRWTRQRCIEWLKSRVPHEVPRSACVFCPYKSPLEWERTKQNPDEWRRAVEIDAALRTEGSVSNRGMNKQLFLHRKCIPLELVDVEGEAAKERERKAEPLFDSLQFDCTSGMCGV